MRYIHLYLLLILGLASCGGEVKQPEEVTQPPAPAADTVKTIKKPVYPSDSEPQYDPAIAPILKVLDSMYSSAPMYFKYGDRYYFYVVNGNWIPYSNDEDVADYKIGIVTDHLDTILPVAYDKIFTPDATAVGYIEIEKDGKHGLVNYQNKTVIPPTYDVIFPSKQKDAIVIGKRGNQHYGILSDGTEQLITDKSKIPTYLGLQKELAFDIKNPKWHYLRDSYAWYYSSNGDTIYEEGRGIIVPPSYMLVTGFVAPILQTINVENDNSEFALTSSYNTIENTVKTKWGFHLLISSFYEEGVEARGYITQTKDFATVDSNNNITGKTSIYFGHDNFEYICQSPKEPYRILGDTLIEAQTLNVKYNGFIGGTGYEGMTQYKYYQIEPNGKILKLETNRLYGFTGFTYITPAHLEGCFFISRYRENGLKWPTDEDQNFYVTHHLTIADLDIMRNEIFADYGYKFKQEKWDKYFRALPWYRPRFDNVDDKLKPWEKANLEVIKAAKEKLLKNPDKYINGHFESYFMAG